MPADLNPTPTTPPAATTFVQIKNGDAVNEDNLMVEAAPGVKPKLTLGLCLNYIYGLKAFLLPGSITRVESGFAIDDTPTPGDLYLPGQDGAIVKAHLMMMPLVQPPHGSLLTSVTVSLTPSTHSNLPATMPTLKVYRITLTTGGATQIGSTATDTSADVTAYDVAHTITAGSLAHTVDRSLYSYIARLTVESSTDSNDLTVLNGFRSTFTPA